MTLENTLKVLEDLSLAAAVRGDTPGTEWLFPIIETCHVLALTVVFGSIARVDLHLVGLTSRGVSTVRLIRETLPWTWVAWGLAAITGSLMFMAKAVAYGGSFEFRMKFACMALAAVNMLVFHFGVYRTVTDWDMRRPPLAARTAGGLSVAFWIAVVFFGRWVGFTT
jgi:hypothetical protein